MKTASISLEAFKNNDNNWIKFWWLKCLFPKDSLEENKYYLKRQKQHNKDLGSSIGLILDFL